MISTRLRHESTINYVIILLFLSNLLSATPKQSDIVSSGKIESLDLKEKSQFDNSTVLNDVSKPDDTNKLKGSDERKVNRHKFDCPSLLQCDKLGGECIQCVFNKSCVYGDTVNVTCKPKDEIICSGNRNFTRSMVCRYCYQTEPWEHVCSTYSSCRVVSSPRERYIANCTVRSEILCLGHRKFLKNVLCNWTAGCKWSTALILSLTLGGFGADRFYLGHWQEGIGKLFSFGGMGVWTLIDVVLIAIGYLGPADGSLYIM